MPADDEERPPLSAARPPTTTRRQQCIGPLDVLSAPVLPPERHRRHLGRLSSSCSRAADPVVAARPTTTKQEPFTRWMTAPSCCLHSCSPRRRRRHRAGRLARTRAHLPPSERSTHANTTPAHSFIPFNFIVCACVSVRASARSRFGGAHSAYLNRFRLLARYVGALAVVRERRTDQSSLSSGGGGEPKWRFSGRG
jgi:hypothetical protein